jgi:biopolymer transport protein ExbB/TolQ
MKKVKSNEFLFEVFSLILIAVLVQGVYATVIRPRADADLARDAAMTKQQPDYIAQRSVYVILKDYEQEICFVLAFWSIAIMGYKAVTVRRSQSLLGQDLLRLPDGMKILPEDSRDYARQVEALPDEMRGELLPRALLTGLHRFGATRNIQDVSTAIHSVCELEFGRLDSELSMVRYVAWAIPAFGFIGTVQGLSQALGSFWAVVSHSNEVGEMRSALQGVTSGLATAFETTLVGLVAALAIHLVMILIKRREEQFLDACKDYCQKYVVGRLRLTAVQEESQE